ncbi:MAG: DUF2254 domain-containing protein [Actinobacteria bacterium]|nr:DUF2254 domain-containing protein [Actinomycetota bacterium]
MNIIAGIRSRLGETLWFIPTLMVIGGIALALGTTILDERLENRPFTEFIFTGGTDSARSILQTVASAVVTFTALVFTITVVALQLASQQFSPRVLRTFLRDALSKFALGTFIATFIYCLMVLRVISGNIDRGVIIPSVSMMALLVLVLASVAMFVGFISHMAHSIRVSQIVYRVGNETRKLIDAMPDSDPGGKDPDRTLIESRTTQTIEAQIPRTLVAVHQRELVEFAVDHEVAFEIARRVGDFLPTGQVVIEVKGGEVPADEVWARLTLGVERTMEQDINFGIRQLVDIAEKALSPSMNDPTTAVVAIDQIHDIMRRLAGKPFPPSQHADDQGVVRLAIPPMQWDALVLLAFGELRQFVGGSLQVTRRMIAALDDLATVAWPERRVALEAERSLLLKVINDSFASSHDREAAAEADQQGVGTRDAPSR